LTVVDKGYKTSPTEDPSNRQETAVLSCGKWARTGVCRECGHEHAAIIFCGREWCPTCREKGSPAHQRRISRWWVRILCSPVWGQLVVTVPPEGRSRLRTRKELSAFRTAVHRWIKRRLPACVGLSRYHFFGDSGKTYHPHLNILLSLGYLPPSMLADLRAFVAKYFGVGGAVVHYRYSRDRYMHKHWVKYITRATFLDEKWDPELANELYRFKNCVVFGAWDRERIRWIKAMYREATAMRCVVCGGRVDWRRGVRVPSSELSDMGFEEIRSGLWAQPPPWAKW